MMEFKSEHAKLKKKVYSILASLLKQTLRKL